ncbi:MAG: YbhB/YbcL family Raf kinase inhibitor-like protein [Bacteroidetes bacterium]|nr:YbhB/YbcL family Raf kinase inhibitor-like protein [Bacteroidota bacterium]
MIKSQLHYSEEVKTLNVRSDAFPERGYIPTKNTCDGENVNPPLEIINLPPDTKSIAVIMEDSDAPIRACVHWIVWNIPPVEKIKEHSSFGIEGLNDFKKFHYCGPCPPSGSHHYHFKVYALNELIDLKEGASKIELEKTMSLHVIAFGELIGIYKRAM